MPYGLNDLWDKNCVIAYANGQNMLHSSSLEEVAAFLVRWATELFSDWATWMLYMFPGCIVSYKTGTLRIADKI